MMKLLNVVLRKVWHIPVLNRLVNRVAVSYFATRTTPRPRAFSLFSAVPKPTDPELQGPVDDYTSWRGLTNKVFQGRHLPPADPRYTSSLPEDAPYNPVNGTIGPVTGLFERKADMLPARSSLLFMFFAQWFTDSVLRTHPVDRRKNTSNHDIDLCQIYGLDEATSNLLRSKRDGKLRSQIINGDEYLDYLHEQDDAGHVKVKAHYRALPYVDSVDALLKGFPPERKERMYAAGLERGNSSIGYVAISTIFMREHNRICDELRKRAPSAAWDDERLFQTARMINIVILLKLVVEDYINHILGYKLFRLDPSFAENQNWYRTNWMAVEFNLLYRWHGLVPDVLRADGKDYDPNAYRNNNALLEELGIAKVIAAASSQNAGLIGLFNTPSFLLGAEYHSLKMGRDFRLRSYNDYREAFHLERLTRFDELTTDPGVQAKLHELYGTMDRVEYVVGIFGENRDRGELFGSLLNRMVAYDAFTQVFSNPLLGRNVFNANTFTQYGLDLFHDTNTVQDLVVRNVRNPTGVVATFDGPPVR